MADKPVSRVTTAEPAKPIIVTAPVTSTTPPVVNRSELSARRAVPAPPIQAKPVIEGRKLHSCPERIGLGDVVLYVLPDGATIRPALVVRIGTTDNLGQQRDESNDILTLHIFYDDQNDRQARGAHADGTISDWKRNIPYDPGMESVEVSPSVWTPNTWHLR
jgi:hypothetical protein